MPKFTNDAVNHVFEGVVSSIDDVLPCPICKSLKSRSANNIHLAPYHSRYQCMGKCKENGIATFYQVDNTPPEMSHEQILLAQELKEKKSKLILP